MSFYLDQSTTRYPFTSVPQSTAAPYGCYMNRYYGFEVAQPPVTVYGNMSISQCDNYCLSTITCLITVHFVHNSTCMSYYTLNGASSLVPSSHNATIGLKNCSCKYLLYLVNRKKPSKYTMHAYLNFKFDNIITELEMRKVHIWF